MRINFFIKTVAVATLVAACSPEEQPPETGNTPSPVFITSEDILDLHHSWYVRDGKSIKQYKH